MAMAMAMAMAFNAIVPSPKRLGIWTVVIRYQGAIIDSVLPNDA